MMMTVEMNGRIAFSWQMCRLCYAVFVAFVVFVVVVVVVWLFSVELSWCACPDVKRIAPSFACAVGLSDGSSTPTIVNHSTLY